MHSCPDCGQACCCGGDFDDLLDVDYDAQEQCDHCLGRDDDEDDDEDDNDSDLFFDPNALPESGQPPMIIVSAEDAFRVVE
jgi:hypothetical protein